MQQAGRTGLSVGTLCFTTKIRLSETETPISIRSTQKFSNLSREWSLDFRNQRTRADQRFLAETEHPTQSRARYALRLTVSVASVPDSLAWSGGLCGACGTAHWPGSRERAMTHLHQQATLPQQRHQLEAEPVTHDLWGTFTSDTKLGWKLA